MFSVSLYHHDHSMNVALIRALKCHFRHRSNQNCASTFSNGTIAEYFWFSLQTHSLSYHITTSSLLSPHPNINTLHSLPSILLFTPLLSLTPFPSILPSSPCLPPYSIAHLPSPRPTRLSQPISPFPQAPTTKPTQTIHNPNAFPTPFPPNLSVRYLPSTHTDRISKADTLANLN